GILAGEHIAGGGLPGAVLQFRAMRVTCHCLAQNDVLGLQAQAAAVEPALRRPARYGAIGTDRIAVAEEGHLPRRAVAWQEVVAAAVLLAGARAEPESQPGPGAALERL